jgi:hypothetical protein
MTIESKLAEIDARAARAKRAEPLIRALNDVIAEELLAGSKFPVPGVLWMNPKHPAAPFTEDINRASADGKTKMLGIPVEFSEAMPEDQCELYLDGRPTRRL